MHKNYKQFLLVAELGSMSLAAEALGLSQPTLSQNMKKLERQYNVDLFIRKSKGVALTEYGELFQQHAIEMQRQDNSFSHQLSDIKARKTRKLKFGTGDAWWEVFVKQALTQYSQQSPAVSIHLEFGNHLKLMDMLLHGHIDLFIGHEIIGLSASYSVNFIPLLQDQEAIFVNQQHPLLNRPIKITDLERFPLLRVTPDTNSHQYLIADPLPKFKDLQRQKVAERIIYEIGSLTASIDFLQTTQAIMPYPHSMAEYFAQFNIIPLELPSSGQGGTVGIYHNSAQRHKHLDDFIALLKTFP